MIFEEKTLENRLFFTFIYIIIPFFFTFCQWIGEHFGEHNDKKGSQEGFIKVEKINIYVAPMFLCIQTVEKNARCAIMIIMRQKENENMAMKIKILGSGGGESFPASFCCCAHCEEARKAGGKSLRSLSQTLIDDDLLIDFPSDTDAHCREYNINLGRI